MFGLGLEFFLAPSSAGGPGSQRTLEDAFLPQESGVCRASVLSVCACAGPFLLYYNEVPRGRLLTKKKAYVIHSV